MCSPTVRVSVTACFILLLSLAPVAAQETGEPEASQAEERPETDLTVEQVLEDFDAAWAAVGELYYLPEFRELNLVELLQPERARVAAAPDAVEAYAILAETIAALESPNTSVMAPWDVPAPPAEDDEGILLEYGGVGILLGTTVEGEVLALQVFRDTPAERSGVLIGDIITRVDDWGVEGEDAIQGVVDRVRGVVDTTVNLTLRDPDGAERTLEVTRAQIDLRPSVVTELIAGGTGYIRIPALSADLVDQASRSIPKLLSSRNLILDLRGVSYGEVSPMITLAQWFLGATSPGGLLTGGGAQGFPFRDDAVAVFQRPMTVLVDSRTSGIPEMLAAVLRSYRRAGLVGGQTSGGFEFTRVQPLPSGGMVGVAFARYLSPDGRLPSLEGLEPDVPVELPDLATIRSGRDVYVEAAIEILETSPRW